MQLELALLSSGWKWGLCDLASTAQPWVGFSCKGHSCRVGEEPHVLAADQWGDSGVMRIKWDDMGPQLGTQAMCTGWLLRHVAARRIIQQIFKRAEDQECV